ncbi:hypothetical protein BKA66DRAFT_423266 [Pyrenochaeta sp. MPI-SDFR-AT-0127]|nr:hypothetical protein BKA66DRAFT_423266 [Pyrenochaeta sp. MPI-SDFR-AT-0127]
MLRTSSNTSPTTTENLLYTTGSTLKTFHSFVHLPPNLRADIWALVAPQPRTRFLELYEYDMDHDRFKFRYIPPLPALFHTTHESRRRCMNMEGGEKIHFYGKPQSRPNCLYFNFSRDIIFLSSRFTREEGTSETFRLQELAVITPKPFLGRFARILVTYSGCDSYEDIGSVLRPYASLETLYIGMMDWWSSRIAKRRVRKGNPATGTVASKIEEVLGKTEAEETDDDEESNEQLDLRAAVSKRRRIVEVEVRLDEQGSPSPTEQP